MGGKKFNKVQNIYSRKTDEENKNCKEWICTEHQKPEKAMKFIKSLVKNRELLIMFINRDIQDKYRGAYAGLAWLVINPLLMLTIYTIVFSNIK